MKRLRALALNIALIILALSVFVLVVACLLQISFNASYDSGGLFDMSGLSADWNYEQVSLSDNFGVAFIGVRASGQSRGFINSRDAVDALLDELAPQLRLLLSQKASLVGDSDAESWKALTDSDEHIYIKLHGELPHKLLPMIWNAANVPLDGDSYMISELLIMSENAETVLYARNASGEMIVFRCNVSFDTERIFLIENLYHDSGFDYTYLTEDGENAIAVPSSSLSYMQIYPERGNRSSDSATKELLDALGLTPQRSLAGTDGASDTYITDKGTVNIGNKLTYLSNGVGIALRSLASYTDSNSLNAYLTASAVLIDTLRGLGYVADDIQIYLSDISADGNALSLNYIYCFDNVAMGDGYSAEIVIKNNKITEFSFDVIGNVERASELQSENPRLLYYSVASKAAHIIDIKPVYAFTSDGVGELLWRAIVHSGGEENEI